VILRVQTADDPSNVNFENLQYTWANRTLRNLASLLITLSVRLL
jgi:hypothetical protein